MPLTLIQKKNRYEALAEAVLHLNKHAATSRLQLRQAVPLLNGSINRGHYRLFHDGERTVGFAAWALADRAAAHSWAFENDGSKIGDGRDGDGVILNFLVTDSVDIVRFAKSNAREVFAGKTFMCGRRSYADARTQAKWIDLV